MKAMDSAKCPIVNRIKYPAQSGSGAKADKPETTGQFPQCTAVALSRQVYVHLDISTYVNNF